MTTHVAWPVGLTKRSEVMILADRTGVTPREAAAAWMEFLEWVSCQESAPVLPGISLESIDRLVSLSGFAATLGQQKWLTQRSDGIHVQQWDEVWSPAVVARKVSTAQKARKRAHLSGQNGQKATQKPLFCPDKPPHTPPVCFGLISPMEEKAVQTAWEVFEAHRIQKDKKSWTEHTRQINIKKTARAAQQHGYRAAVSMLEKSVEGGWTRLIDPTGPTEHDVRTIQTNETTAWLKTLTQEQRDEMLDRFRAELSRKDQDRPGAFMRWAEQQRSVR